LQLEGLQKRKLAALPANMARRAKRDVEEKVLLRFC
jgi:hypothetical protein